MLLEKAIKYVEDVVNGQELTTQEVKKQCEWFLDEYNNRQHKDDFPFILGEKVCKKIDGLLKLINFGDGIFAGESVYEHIAGFQCFALVNIFGWRYKDNTKKYRYRDITIFIPRKEAKTFLTALILIIKMLIEPKNSQFYSICLDRESASLVKDAMRLLISSSPYLSSYFKINKSLNSKNFCTLTNSFYQPRTCEHNRNNGIKPATFIADEYGAMKDVRNYNAMRSGQKSILQKQSIKITTAYAEDKSPMLDELEYLRKIYNGDIVDYTYFALLYYATEEHLWDDEGLEMSHPLKNEDDFEEIRNTRRLAMERPDVREEYLTKDMNHFVPSNTAESFVTRDQIRKCAVNEPFDCTGKNVYVGVDLAQSGDNTAVVIAYQDSEKIHAKAFDFIPANKIEEKSKAEKIDYKRFIAEGSCFACGDNVIDYGFVEDFVLSIEERFKCKIVQIGYDIRDALSSAQKFSNAGYICVEVKQHSSVLGSVVKWIEELINQGDFVYDGDELFTREFINCKYKLDNNMGKYLTKKESSRLGKIDMVFALQDAMYLMQQSNLYVQDEGFYIL